MNTSRLRFGTPLRVFTFLGLLVGLVATLGAQEGQPPPGKDKKAVEDKSKEVMAQVAKDMQNSEERLKKSDPGDVTRKIQRDIIDGLDELIKQSSQPQSGGGGGGQSSKMQQKQQQQDMAAQQKNAGGQDNAGKEKGGAKDQQLGAKNDPNGQDMEPPGKAKGGKDDGPQGKEKDKGKGEGDDKEGTAKDAGKDDKDGKQGTAKEGDPDKNGGQGGLAKVKNDRPPKSNLASDLNRNPWGHLPDAKRLEMDAYAKERFMPRYDEVLQQYYRTIAEQGRKKE